MTIRFLSLGRVSILAAFAAALLPSSRSLAWTSFSLPNLSQDFGVYEAANLPDGQFVYGSTNSLALQTSFGSSPITPYSNPQSWDPSSIAIQSNTLGVVGAGMFGQSSIYTFNPSSPATTFTPIPGLSIQNYSMVFRDGTSIYVGGIEGSQSTGDAVSYVTLDGTVNKVIIGNISTYSGGIAIDQNGNLYVVDDDTLGLYRFTAGQLKSAIVGPALSIANGTYVTTLQADGSIAVDAEGRIWSAGYQIDGLDVFDPSDGLTTSIIPALDNDNYVVSAFSSGANSYVAYLNASGFVTGSGVTYGYADVASLIPEPSAAILLLLGIGGAAARRRR